MIQNVVQVEGFDELLSVVETGSESLAALLVVAKFAAGFGCCAFFFYVLDARGRW